MTDQHPITPPPELVQQWLQKWHSDESIEEVDSDIYIANRAAQWGADRELDALRRRARLVLPAAGPSNERLPTRVRSCEWLPIENSQPYSSGAMRAARRPKPPSLKERALEDLDELVRIARQAGVFNPPENIRRALEALPE